MPDDERGVYSLTVERPETASQSLLARIDVCPYSGGLYIKHKGSPPSHAMARGTCFHYYLERYHDFLIENDETSAPPEVGKDLMQAILDERTDLAIPAYEQNALRIMAWNHAGATVLDPEAQAGIEETFRFEVGGWTLRGRVDQLEIFGNEAWIKDYKTSLNMPDQEHFEENFQTLFYALAVAEGELETDGKPSGIRLGQGVDIFHLAQVFPRYTNAEGNLVDRSAQKDRGQLHDFRRTLESHLAKLERGLDKGEWAATDGDHCRTCPARRECPIPPTLRRDIKVAETPEDARELASLVANGADNSSGYRAALKDYVDQSGEMVPYGEKLWGFLPTQSLVTEKGKKERLLAFIRESGHDIEEFFSVRKSTKFDLRPKEKYEDG